MMTNLKKSKKGFTLVELIVVIAILAIIAAVAIPTTIAYIGSSERGTAYSNAGTVLRQVQNNANDLRNLEVGTTDGKSSAELVKILTETMANPAETITRVEVMEDGTIIVYTDVPHDDDDDYTIDGVDTDYVVAVGEAGVAMVIDTPEASTVYATAYWTGSAWTVTAPTTEA